MTRGKIDPAAVVGVGIAAVVSMVISPSPYDWWSTMIGLALLAVLVGFAQRPASLREMAGVSAVAALVILQILGRPIEQFLDYRFSGRTSGSIALRIWALLWLLLTISWLALREDLRHELRLLTARFFVASRDRPARPDRSDRSTRR
jgi:uncharacterized membrane protein YccC